MRRVATSFAVLAIFALLAVAQQQRPTGDYYIDVYMVKVKPEKRAQFDNLVRQFVDANRKNSGDMWLASETAYGEQNTVYFSSRRENYDGAEKGEAAFESALNKAFGADGSKKMMQDWNDCLIESRAELWRHRSDLSMGPADAASQARLVGQSRWLRTMALHVRPGKQPEFESAVRSAMDAIRKGDPNWVGMVRQAVMGNDDTVYYITTPVASFAAFDKMASMPSFKQLMGEQNFQKWESMVADTVIRTETRVSRLMPEFSNAPAEIMAAAPNFWQPGPVEARR